MFGLGTLLFAGASAAGNYLAARQRKGTMEDALGRARHFLSPEATKETFGQLQDLYGPTASALAADLSTQNQAVGTAIQAGMNTRGLGDTGLGLALAGGARRGASFRNRQLLADMDRAALQEAIQLNQQRANLELGGGMQLAQVNPIGAALQGASSGAGAFMNYQMAKENQEYRNEYMDWLTSQSPNALD